MGGRAQLSVCRVQAWLIVFLSNSLNNVEGASQCTQPCGIVLECQLTAGHDTLKLSCLQEFDKNEECAKSTPSGWLLSCGSKGDGEEQARSQDLLQGDKHHTLLGKASSEVAECGSTQSELHCSRQLRVWTPS